MTGQQAAAELFMTAGRAETFLALLEKLSHDLAWQADAACAGHDTAVFFPPKGGSVEPAKEICDTCPVQAACAAAGAEEVHGVWAGKSTEERRTERRERRAA